TLTPQSLWAALSDHWQAKFILNHLLLTPQMVTSQLGSDETELTHALQKAEQLAEKSESPIIELGFVAAGLMLAAPGVQHMLVQLKTQPDDIEAVANWFARNLQESRIKKRSFGGIGRD